LNFFPFEIFTTTTETMAVVKRFSLNTQPLSKSMIGAIVAGAIVVFLSFVGLIVFLCFYARSAKKPNPAHIGPYAVFPAKGKDVEASAGAQSLGDVSNLETASTLVGTPNPTPQSTITKPPPNLKIALATPPITPNPEAQPEAPRTPTTRARPSTAALSETTITPRRGRNQQLQVEDEKRWDSVASSDTIEQPPTPGRTFV
jgi:hypothetical protein